ncbi:MAG TPA: hypothetical protein VKR58_12025, partial [Aquella sp.]|nr:hypothetical protein [Aquella sp.]
MNSWNEIKDLSSKLKGLSTIGLANILGSVISGLFWLYIARIIGTTHYGEVNYLLAIAGIGVLFGYIGSANTILVYVPKGIKLQSTVYAVALVASIAIAVVLFIVFHNIAVSTYVIGNVIFGLATSDLLAKKNYRSYFAYFIASKLLTVGLSLILYHYLGPDGIILGITFSFLPCLVIVYKGFRESKIDFALLRTRLRFIINSYILDMTRTFSTTADKLIVGPLLGYAILGNYSLGLQFLSLLTILPGIVYQYTLPHDASGTSNKKLKQATILVSTLFAILSIFLSPIVLPVLFPKFTAAIGVIQIVSLGIIPISISNVYISKFLAKEDSRIVLVGSAIFLGVLIPTIFLLGKMIGVNGVAAAFVLAQSSETAYLFFINKYVYKIKSEKMPETPDIIEKIPLLNEKKEKFDINEIFKFFIRK